LEAADRKRQRDKRRQEGIRRIRKLRREQEGPQQMDKDIWALLADRYRKRYGMTIRELAEQLSEKTPTEPDARPLKPNTLSQQISRAKRSGKKL
jgi:hypothetical protein